MGIRVPQSNSVLRFGGRGSSAGSGKRALTGLYGGIGVIVPGTGLSKTQKFPDDGDGTWDMGPSGIVMINRTGTAFDRPPDRTSS